MENPRISSFQGNQAKSGNVYETTFALLSKFHQAYYFETSLERKRHPNYTLLPYFLIFVQAGKHLSSDINDWSCENTTCMYF